MPAYRILRVQTGWITNEDGDFLIEGTDNSGRFWIPNNVIGFNDKNEPFIKSQSNDSNHDVLTVYNVSNEFLNQSMIETSSSQSLPKERQSETENQEKKNMWSAHDTLALITAVEAHHDDMHHVIKRKTFWSVISEELCSQNIIVSDVNCKKKWLNLVRTYKTCKDNQKKTGRGPTKFEFFNRLDEFLGDSPTNASPHSLDVAEIENTPSVSDTESSGSNDLTVRKRKNSTLQLAAVKKQFYQGKLEQNAKKEENRRWYLQESLKYRTDKIEILKKKLEIDERKLKVLDEIKDELKRQNR